MSGDMIPKLWESPLVPSPEDRLQYAIEEIHRLEGCVTQMAGLSFETARSLIPAVDNYCNLLESRYDEVERQASHWDEKAYEIMETYDKEVAALAAEVQRLAGLSLTIRREVFGQNPPQKEEQVEVQGNTHTDRADG